MESRHRPAPAVPAPEDMPTLKLEITDLQMAPTRKLSAQERVGYMRTHRLRQTMTLESQPLLAAMSGITPIPVETQAELLIDAGWYRRIYAWLDRISGQKAAKLMQILSFLVIGGSASLVNLAVVYAFTLIDRTHENDVVHHAIYAAIATEISLLYNFMLNDRFTFRAMIDGRRNWLQRCLRFHAPASVGFVLTLALSSLFFILTKPLPHHAVISQAMAIVIVTAVNFLMHSLWTYRPAKATATARTAGG
jgi:putative flippase GtrA